MKILWVLGVLMMASPLLANEEVTIDGGARVGFDCYAGPSDHQQKQISKLPHLAVQDAMIRARKHCLGEVEVISQWDTETGYFYSGGYIPCAYWARATATFRCL